MSRVPGSLLSARLRQMDIAAALIVLLALLSVGCGADGSHTVGPSSPSSPPSSTPNHVHDMLALHGVPHTALVATHAGIYRTMDSGRTWSEVAGGRGQVMDGLMTHRLLQSPVDPSRLFVLGVPRTAGQSPATTAGVYTSADAGQTWQLAAPFSVFPGGSVFSLGAGPSAAGQVYAILSGIAQGRLVASDDFGRQWRSMPPVPTAEPTGVISVTTAHAHRLLLWSGLDGIFFSDNAGQQWQHSMGIQQGIDEVAAAGVLVYADGPAGVFISRDGGTTFHLATSQYPLYELSVCVADPNYAYAVSDTQLYVTMDGGQTWWPTATTKRPPVGLAADPVNPNVVYVGLSVPMEVDVTVDSGQHWIPTGL
jgi:photosystem II stability/assembly factor-like uncharacterized protein